MKSSLMLQEEITKSEKPLLAGIALKGRGMMCSKA